MTVTLRDYHPADREQLAWVQDVDRKFRDVEGVRASFRYLDSRKPFVVKVPVASKPWRVEVARAFNKTSLLVESGARVTWTWRAGTVRVEAIDLSSTTDEYDVELVVWME